VVVAADTRLAEALAFNRQVQPANEQTDGTYGTESGLVRSRKRDRRPDRDGQEFRSGYNSPDARNVRGFVERSCGGERRHSDIGKITNQIGSE